MVDSTDMTRKAEVQVATLPVADLELCDRTRSRKNKPKEAGETVQEYAEAYEAGLILEPLDVFCERGAQRYIVADGEHRLLALRRAKIKEVECRLHEGGEVDALRFALTTNHAHGVRLTKEDRYYRFCRIKETALEKEFRTDRQLSEAIGVSISTIQRYGVQWRNSGSRSQRIAKSKADAKESAAKHAPKEKQLSEKYPTTARPPEPELVIDKFAEPAEIEPPKPADEPVANPAKRPLPKGAGGTPLPSTAVHDVLRGIGLIASCEVSMARLAATGKLDWAKVESAAEKLVELLESR